MTDKGYSLPFEKWWKRHYKKVSFKQLWGEYKLCFLFFFAGTFCLLIYVADKLWATTAFNIAVGEWNLALAGFNYGEMVDKHLCIRYHTRESIRKMADEELEKALLQVEAEIIKDGNF